MNARDFQKFVKFLIENYQVWSPQEEGGEGLIKELSEPEKAAFSSRLPFYSWKKFFIPECENIFEYHGNSLSPVWQMPAGKKGAALLGLNILDLKSVLLYDRVFSAKGGSASGGQPPASFKIFTGSEKGQKVLDDFGYKDYEYIEFAGQINEDRPGSKMTAFRDKLKNRHNQKIWEELGKICIECGKCTIVCPTCFCFRIDDFSRDTNAGERQRCWDSCFYNEFSEVAGGRKFLNR